MSATSTSFAASPPAPPVSTIDEMFASRAAFRASSTLVKFLLLLIPIAMSSTRPSDLRKLIPKSACGLPYVFALGRLTISCLLRAHPAFESPARMPVRANACAGSRQQARRAPASGLRVSASNPFRESSVDRSGICIERIASGLEEKWRIRCLPARTPNS